MRDETLNPKQLALANTPVGHQRALPSEKIWIAGGRVWTRKYMFSQLKALAREGLIKREGTDLFYREAA